MTTYWFVVYSLGNNDTGHTGMGNCAFALDGEHIMLRQITDALHKENPGMTRVITNFQQISRETFKEFTRG
ncbi:hypothetical protein HOB10_02050 [Candidatus Parcubacteria bacterium]|jgi:hypothetical protein|nr:hypothetical protein [Candidatus Parcubacteria bacterium]